MKAFCTAADVMGRRTDVVAPSDFIVAIDLAAESPKTVAVPPRACVVLSNATGDVWISYGRPALLPTADMTDGSAPELNPGARLIDRVSILGLVAPAACRVCLAFYG